MKYRRYANLFSDNEKLDRILGNFIDEAPLDDPTETGTSAFGPPTANRKVLETQVVAEGSYGSQLLYHDQAI